MAFKKICKCEVCDRPVMLVKRGPKPSMFTCVECLTRVPIKKVEKLIAAAESR